jgi:hypothetical protein
MRTATRLFLAGLVSVLALGVAAPAATAGPARPTAVSCCR